MLLLLNHVDAAHVAFYVDSSECACIHTVDTLRNCKSVCMCVCVCLCVIVQDHFVLCVPCVCRKMCSPTLKMVFFMGVFVRVQVRKCLDLP